MLRRALLTCAVCCTTGCFASRALVDASVDAAIEDGAITHDAIVDSATKDGAIDTGAADAALACTAPALLDLPPLGFSVPAPIDGAMLTVLTVAAHTITLASTAPGGATTTFHWAGPAHPFVAGDVVEIVNPPSAQAWRGIEGAKGLALVWQYSGPGFAGDPPAPAQIAPLLLHRYGHCSFAETSPPTCGVQLANRNVHGVALTQLDVSEGAIPGTTSNLLGIFLTNLTSTSTWRAKPGTCAFEANASEALTLLVR
jgi:hypothetical protein